MVEFIKYNFSPELDTKKYFLTKTLIFNKKDRFNFNSWNLSFRSFFIHASFTEVTEINRSIIITRLLH